MRKKGEKKESDAVPKVSFYTVLTLGSRLTFYIFKN